MLHILSIQLSTNYADNHGQSASIYISSTKQSFEMIFFESFTIFTLPPTKEQLSYGKYWW